MAGKLLKRGSVAPDDDLCAFQAVVVPAPTVTDLEASVAALNTVPGVTLAVVGTLGHVYLSAGDK